MLRLKRLPIAGIALALGLAGCSGGAASNPQTVTQANIGASALQFAVGTANIFGDTPAAAVTGLNVVATYRQPAGALAPGDSATLVNSPTITGPFTLPATAGTPDAFHSTVVSGPAPTEIGTRTLTSTPQGATATTSFGIDGGVFGFGIEPFNYGNRGVPLNITPYQVPLFDAVGAAFDPAGDLNAFIPWGGPPAFDANHDGQGTRDGRGYPTLPGQTTDGISEGLDVFAGVTPAAGAYTLTVGVPILNAGTFNQNASATMTSVALLPAVAPAVPTLGSAGSMTFNVTLPAGVKEAYVQVVDIGTTPDAGGNQATSCNGASDPSVGGRGVYYTMVAHASGTVTLPATSGPSGGPALCTTAQNTTTNKAPTEGDRFTVQTIGFDYNAFEADYPNSLRNPAPALGLTNGQADITISSQVLVTQPTAGGLLSTRRRAP